MARAYLMDGWQDPEPQHTSMRCSIVRWATALEVHRPGLMITQVQSGLSRLVNFPGGFLETQYFIGVFISIEQTDRL